jgi:hypothetical protein
MKTGEEPKKQFREERRLSHDDMQPKMSRFLYETDE